MRHTNYAEHVAADRRLVMCRVLNEAPGYSANSSILHGILGEFGHRVSRDRIAGDLDWLAEQGVVTLEELAVPGLRIATLTQKGADVAEGNTTIHGIKRPGPSV